MRNKFCMHTKLQVVREAPKVVEVVQAPKVETVTTASSSSSFDIDALLAKYKYSTSSYTPAPAVTTNDYQVTKKSSIQ